MWQSVSKTNKIAAIKTFHDTSPSTHLSLWLGDAQIYAYSLAKPVKHCLKIGEKMRFEGIGRRQECCYIIVSKQMWMKERN